jgi:predicted phage baseplate assembly protein
MAGLLEPLRRRPAPGPANGRDLERSASSTFAPASDSITRLLVGLDPHLSPTLYPALATSTVGTPPLQGITTPRVKAAPFGVQAPLQQLIDGRGRPAGTQEWDLDGTIVFKAVVSRPADVPLGIVNVAGATSDPVQVSLSVVTPDGTVQASPFTLDVPPNPVQLGKWSVTQTVDAANASATLTFQEGHDPKGATALKLTANTAIMANRAMLANAATAISATDLAAVLPLRLSIAPDTVDWGGEIPSRMTIGEHRLVIDFVYDVQGRPVPNTHSITLEIPRALSDPTVLTLDSRYDQILPDSWIVIERAAKDAALLLAKVLAVETVAAARYNMTGRVTQLRLDRPWLDPPARSLAAARKVTVWAQPDPLDVAPSIVSDDVGGKEIELDRLHAGLEAGRWLIVSGTRSDLPGTAEVPGSELAMIAAVRQSADPELPGDVRHSTIVLAAPLTYRYRRNTVQIMGNVVLARHGESVQEVIGSGAAAETNQSFALSRSPVLADDVGALNPISSLSILVDGLAWTEVDDLAMAKPGDRVYSTSTDALGTTTVLFGDGVRGARLPSGKGNVAASYRIGLGERGNARAGQVCQLLSRPLAVRDVTNPLPSSGGLPGQGAAALRAKATAGLSSLDRIVTVADYEDLARSWAAVGKARARWISDGDRPMVHLSIAGADATPLDTHGALCEAVLAAVSAAGDPTIPVTVSAGEAQVLILQAAVRRDQRYPWAIVVERLTAALLDRFGYASRDFAEDVTLTDLISVAHSVPGVASFVVDALAVVGVAASPAEIERITTSLTQRPPERIRVLGARREKTVVTLAKGDTLSSVAANHGISVADLGELNPGLDGIAPKPGTRLVVADGLRPAQIAYLTDAVTDSLILNEAPA